MARERGWRVSPSPAPGFRAIIANARDTGETGAGAAVPSPPRPATPSPAVNLRLIVNNGEPSGDILKDKGIARVRIDPRLQAAWDKKINELPPGYEFITEEIRLACLAAGAPAPPKSQHWGALALRYSRMGYMVLKHPRQQWKTTDRTSHARWEWVWIKTALY
jgi:hypothetical protein